MRSSCKQLRKGGFTTTFTPYCHPFHSLLFCQELLFTPSPYFSKVSSYETIVSSHMSISTWFENTFRAFLYRFANMTSLNETSSRWMIFLVVPSLCVIDHTINTQNNRPTHNKIRQFDVRKSQWICFLISGKRPKNVGIMLKKVANYLYLSS